MFKSFSGLFVLAFSPLMFGMEQVRFFQEDEFFSYEYAKDDILEKLFLRFYNDLLRTKGNSDGTCDCLVQHSEKIAKHIRQKDELKPLFGVIEEVIASYKNCKNLTNFDVERITNFMLFTLEHKAQFQLTYLAPMLARYQDYIILFGDENQAKDRAIWFLLYYLINPFLVASKAIYAKPVAGLLKKMLRGREQDSVHRDFLRQRQLIAVQAFGYLDSIRNRLTYTPTLKTIFSEALKNEWRKRPNYSSATEFLVDTYHLDRVTAKKLLKYSLAIQYPPPSPKI
jgi:hypothetical protein